MSIALMPRPTQCNDQGQIVYVADGLAVVGTLKGIWAVPKRHAIWLPPQALYGIRDEPTLLTRTLAIGPGLAQQLADAAFVFAVSPLMREAILRYLILIGEAPTDAPRRRLLGVIMDQIAAAKPAPWFLPLPRDQRLSRITGALTRDPADNRRLGEFAKVTGVSPRSLARRYVNETGMTFGAWRQRLRLLTAMTLLEAGTPVAAVAHDTGFASPSAFIAAFKRATGSPPGRYFRRGELGFRGPSALLGQPGQLRGLLGNFE